MIVFIVRAGNGRMLCGSFNACLKQALDWVHEDPLVPAKIFRARGGEKEARVIAEATPDGIRFIRRGRVLAVHKLLR